METSNKPEVRVIKGRAKSLMGIYEFIEGPEIPPQGNPWKPATLVIGDDAIPRSRVVEMLEEVKAAAARNATACYTSRIAQMTPPHPIAFEIDTIAARFGLTL